MVAVSEAPEAAAGRSLLLRGGVLVDGSGAPPRRADVVVRAGEIAEIRPPAGPREREELDVSGLVVSPGFIDIHTHSDASLLHDGRAESKVHQGVTTEVIGNCGFSAFPLNEAFRADHLALLAGIGDDPTAADWSDFDGYGRALEASGISVNVAAMVGHGQLRIAAMGAGALRAAPSEIDRMRELLALALRQGVFGMSTGLTYVPSSHADADEIDALARVLAEYGAIYATHGRGEGPQALREAAGVGRRTGVRVQYSHVSINDPTSWGSAAELLGTIDDARAEGIDMACDVYPYDASSSALTQYLPLWVQDGGAVAMQRRLDDPEQMKAAERDLARGWGARQEIAWQWDRVVLARTEGRCGAVPGESVAEASRRLGRTPESLVLDLCRLGGNAIQVVLFYRREADVEVFLRYAHTSLGSDGAALPMDGEALPHPRAFGAHARLLSRYVRERGVLGVSGAVHKMTGMVADRMGIRDRGRLLPGYRADLVVWDPESVKDNATYAEPRRPPSGIRDVMVNGEFVVRQGTHTDARPGRVLRAR